MSATSKQLREWAANPAGNGMVPIHPDTLIALAVFHEAIERALAVSLAEETLERAAKRDDPEPVAWLYERASHRSVTLFEPPAEKTRKLHDIYDSATITPLYTAAAIRSAT